MSDNEQHPPSTVSGKALAAGTENLTGKALATGSACAGPETTGSDNAGSGSFPLALFLTWTTYGTWLPGDPRGWRKWKRGERPPQPLLEDWCRDRMKEQPVVLTHEQRDAVERVIVEHAAIRGWLLHAVSVRSNHVHVVVSANAEPKKVRDQFKANATRVLRALPEPITNEKIWTRGGDIEFIDTEDDLEQVILYVTEAQDRMDRQQ